MDVRNCMKCNKLFNYVTGQPICANCRKELDEQFKEVRLYIRKNPKASIHDVANDCEVDIKQIRQWIREERLSFSADSPIGIECEVCGKNIRTGRFCDGCKADISHNLGRVYEKKEEKEENPFENRDTSNKMRFLNKDRLQ